MTRVAHGFAVLGIALFTGSLAMAQQPAGTAQAAPPPFTNIQIWPKDTPRATILQFMNAFSSSLGVKCDYCHVQEGPGGRNDFASDEKRAKVVARQMILMRDAINVMLPTFVGKPPGIGPTSGEGRPGAPIRVLCSMCHHGLPIPKQLADVVSEAEAGGGARVGLAKFKELRAQYFGGQAYDFSDNGLVSIAARSMAAKKPDDALAYLQANLEYYPKSAPTYQSMAQAKIAKGDKAGALKDLEKAVELDPSNVQAKTQLQQLKAQ